MLGQSILYHCQCWRHKQGIQHFSAAKATETQREQIPVIETAVPTIMARKTPSEVLRILTFSSLVVLYFRIDWKVHIKKKQNKTKQKNSNHEIWWCFWTICKRTVGFLLEVCLWKGDKWLTFISTERLLNYTGNLAAFLSTLSNFPFTIEWFFFQQDNERCLLLWNYKLVYKSI